MLVLRRKAGEGIVIASGAIVVSVLEVRGRYVRLGVTAPGDVSVNRNEVQEAIDRENKTQCSGHPSGQSSEAIGEAGVGDGDCDAKC